MQKFENILTYSLGEVNDTRFCIGKDEQTGRLMKVTKGLFPLF